jgi:hypothetical protein
VARVESTRPSHSTARSASSASRTFHCFRRRHRTGATGRRRRSAPGRAPPLPSEAVSKAGLGCAESSTSARSSAQPASPGPSSELSPTRSGLPRRCMPTSMSRRPHPADRYLARPSIPIAPPRRYQSHISRTRRLLILPRLKVSAASPSCKCAAMSPRADHTSPPRPSQAPNAPSVRSTKKSLRGGGQS